MGTSVIDEISTFNSVKLPRVYVVDDHAPMRASLEVLLLDVAEVVCFSSGEAFLDQHETLLSGILLTDVRMEKMSGLDLVRRLAGLKQKFRPIIMTAHGDIDTAVAALRAGACDFLQKPFSFEDLLAIIKREASLLAGVDGLFDRPAAARAAIKTLSPRELEVTQRLARGGTNKSIANELSLSVRTVEMHRARAMARLNCKSLAELVNFAILSELADQKR